MKFRKRFKNRFINAKYYTNAFDVARRDPPADVGTLS